MNGVKIYIYIYIYIYFGGENGVELMLFLLKKKTKVILFEYF